jgi:hypothetical protein
LAVKWKNGFNPEVIVGKLSIIRHIDGEKVSFGGIEYDEYISVLKSMIDVDENISTEIVHGLIVKGFHEAAKKTELTTKNVISYVKKAVREYLSKPDKAYWLVTTMNIHNSNDLPRYRINGCSLCFCKKLPKKYREARQKFISRASSLQIGKDDSFSHYLVAQVSGKSAHDAVERILDAIDLLRGIWNLHTNKIMVLSFDGHRKPVNQILLGALHTIHDKNGKKIGNTFWYDPEHFKDHAKVDFSKNSYKTLEFTKNVRKALNKNSYKQDVGEAIVRYVRALDSHDYNSVFIKLWSVLEFLTYTLKDSYDKTIKRVSFQYQDREYTRQILEHLRQYRNKSVHLGAGENDIEAHVYQLKSFVERLLRFHIENHFKFGSLEEAAKFMDLPPDIGALKKQIALCQAGVKFLEIA